MPSLSLKPKQHKIFLYVRGMIKKFSVPCTLSYQGMKIRPLLFNIISLQGNALSPSLFELSYPFKKQGIFLVPQVLVYCLNDAFIATKYQTKSFSDHRPYNEDEISVFGTDRRQKEPYQENMGMREDFKSTFSRSSHGNL